ncbi:MAG: EI24 domain-containing protein [Alphaproteobacteria bacterium]|nr:EI24 domain-containing protein [Alphaproteobacteria bacterium]
MSRPTASTAPARAALRAPAARALARGAGDLFSGPLLLTILKAALVSLALAVGLFLAGREALGLLPDLGPAWLDRLAEVLGQLGLLVGLVLMMPAVTALFLGLFAEGLANRLEARRYPEAGPPRDVPFLDGLVMGLRLLGAVLIGNLLALPVYLFLPGLNLAVFLLVNGLLVGREFFELVALRRMAPAQVRALRRGNRLRILALGAASAVLMLVPVLGLVAPLFATALMVHFVAGLRPASEEGARWNRG